MAAETRQHRKNTFCPCHWHKHSRSDGDTHLGTSPQAQSPRGWSHIEAIQTLYLLPQPSHSTASTLYTLERLSRQGSPAPPVPVALLPQPLSAPRDADAAPAQPRQRGQAGIRGQCWQLLPRAGEGRTLRIPSFFPLNISGFWPHHPIPPGSGITASCISCA